MLSMTHRRAAPSALDLREARRRYVPRHFVKHRIPKKAAPAIVVEPLRGDRIRDEDTGDANTRIARTASDATTHFPWPPGSDMIISIMSPKRCATVLYTSQQIIPPKISPLPQPIHCTASSTRMHFVNPKKGMSPNASIFVEGSSSSSNRKCSISNERGDNQKNCKSTHRNTSYNNDTNCNTSSGTNCSGSGKLHKSTSTYYDKDNHAYTYDHHSNNRMGEEVNSYGVLVKPPLQTPNTPAPLHCSSPVPTLRLTVDLPRTPPRCIVKTLAMPYPPRYMRCSNTDESGIIGKRPKSAAAMQ